MAGKGKSILDGFLYVFNVIVAIALLVSYLAYYFDPQLTSIFAFFGLAYPVLLGLNLLFILYWLIRLKLKITLSIVCIGIGYLHLLRFYQFSGEAKVVNPGESLKVMTYNVRQFNKYTWLDLPNVQDEIVNLVGKQNPDLLLMQEYHNGQNAPQFDLPHRHQAFDISKKKSGMVIFSRYPFQKTGVIEFGQGPDGKDAGKALFADIVLDGKTLRVINVHLASVGFKLKEYERLENPNAGDQEEIKRDFTKIINQLRQAFKKRSHQVKIIEQAIESSPHPVILAGDFNDTPQSYAYHRIELLLADTYLESGEGWPRTYTQGPLPFRIDHIFHDAVLHSYNYQIIAKELSDHYPVVTEIRW